jgi:hypothetical protein
MHERGLTRPELDGGFGFRFLKLQQVAVRRTGDFLDLIGHVDTDLTT